MTSEIWRIELKLIRLILEVEFGDDLLVKENLLQNVFQLNVFNFHF